MYLCYRQIYYTILYKAFEHPQILVSEGFWNKPCMDTEGQLYQDLGTCVSFSSFHFLHSFHSLHFKKTLDISLFHPTFLHCAPRIQHQSHCHTNKINNLELYKTSSLGREDPLEKGKATHSSILAWRIPGTV